MKNKRMKLSKAGMLCNNTEFKSRLNLLRKLINKYHNLNVFDDDSYLAQCIKSEFKLIMDEFDVGFTTICQVIRISYRNIYIIIGKQPFTKVVVKQKSLLVDRLHYARLIDEGVLTYNDVVEKTDYKYITVWQWVSSYRTYGNDMLNKAIAFRRV